MPTYFAVTKEALDTTEIYTPSTSHFIFWSRPCGETITRQKGLCGMDIIKHVKANPTVTLYTNEQEAYKASESSAVFAGGYLNSTKPLLKININSDSLNDKEIVNLQKHQVTIEAALILQPGKADEKSEIIATYVKGSHRTSRFVFEPERETAASTATFHP